MKDIRLLTLYKQHYLDNYVSPLKAHITCLGYYDGMDIDRIEEDNSGRLSRKLSDSPISTIWYATGKKIEKINGSHGNQHIGIFRDDNDNERMAATQLFWSEAQKLPYCSIGFVKLKGKYQNQYKDIEKKIEKRYSIPKDAQKEKVCYVLPYYTFDNADIIILLRSNSLTELEKTHHDIEVMEEVAYLHSVLGIDEKYMNLCYQNEKILEFWGSTNCFTDETIQNLELQIATSGEPEILGCLKKQLDDLNAGKKYAIKNYGSVKYAYIGGHANISISLEDTDVASLVTFMLPKGFATHQNPLYGNGIYNIKSSVCMKYCDWSTIAVEAKELVTRKMPVQKRWCLRVLEQCRKYIPATLGVRDENLYSLFLTMIRTLNNLDQYEGFAISEDIFYMIAPSFYMFNEKLERAIQKNCLKNVVLNEMVKKAMREYLEYVNSVVYHTIHMDQRYLMVPGCSETSYSLPIKLQICYLWFANRISDLLNDNGRRYSCILATVMESRPETQCIELIPNDKDKIICVRLSQRSLFFPRNLMLILTHELAHYIGKNFRCRQSRIRQMIKSMVYMLVEGIIPAGYEEKWSSQAEQKIFLKLKKKIKEDLKVVIGTEMRQKIPHAFQDKEYHAKNIEKPLVKLCMDVISDIGCIESVQDVIYRIPEEVLADLNPQNSDEYIACLQFINEVQNTLERNRKNLLMSDVINKTVRCLITLYQEVFSDLAAVTILDADFTDYQEAFAVSEGVNVTNTRSTREQKVRAFIVSNTIFSSQSIEVPVSQERMVTERCKDEELYSNIYHYIWVRMPLLEYAKECYKVLCKMRDENRTKIEKVREKYEMFTSHQVTVEHIYEEMHKCIQEYKEESIEAIK